MQRSSPAERVKIEDDPVTPPGGFIAVQKVKREDGPVFARLGFWNSLRPRKRAKVEIDSDWLVTDSGDESERDSGDDEDAKDVLVRYGFGYSKKYGGYRCRKCHGTEDAKERIHVREDGGLFYKQQNPFFQKGTCIC